MVGHDGWIPKRTVGPTHRRNRHNRSLWRRWTEKSQCTEILHDHAAHLGLSLASEELQEPPCAHEALWRRRGMGRHPAYITPISQPEASLWLYESALPRPEEESRMAMRGLRPGELVPTPQPAGPTRGVVSLEAGKWASAIKQTTSQAHLSRAFPPKCGNSSANPSALENHPPAQMLLKMTCRSGERVLCQIFEQSTEVFGAL